MKHLEALMDVANAEAYMVPLYYQIQSPIMHCEMVGVEEISFAVICSSAGDHAGSLSSLHLRPQTSTALNGISDACYELYR